MSKVVNETPVELAVLDEQVRWQERLNWLHLEIPGVDGSGTDSGDPLDLTACEVHQAINYYRERVALLEAQLAQAAKFVISGERQGLPYHAEIAYFSSGGYTAWQVFIQYDGKWWYCAQDLVLQPSTQVASIHGFATADAARTWLQEWPGVGC